MVRGLQTNKDPRPEGVVLRRASIRGQTSPSLHMTANLKTDTSLAVEPFLPAMLHRSDRLDVYSASRSGNPAKNELSGVALFLTACRARGFHDE